MNWDGEAPGSRRVLARASTARRCPRALRCPTPRMSPAALHPTPPLQPCVSPIPDRPSLTAPPSEGSLALFMLLPLPLPQKSHSSGSPSPRRRGSSLRLERPGAWLPSHQAVLTPALRSPRASSREGRGAEERCAPGPSPAPLLMPWWYRQPPRPWAVSVSPAAGESRLHPLSPPLPMAFCSPGTAKGKINNRGVGVGAGQGQGSGFLEMNFPYGGKSPSPLHPALGCFPFVECLRREGVWGAHRRAWGKRVPVWSCGGVSGPRKGSGRDVLLH